MPDTGKARGASRGAKFTPPRSSFLSFRARERAGKANFEFHGVRGNYTRLVCQGPFAEHILDSQFAQYPLAPLLLCNSFSERALFVQLLPPQLRESPAGSHHIASGVVEDRL